MGSSFIMSMKLKSGAQCAILWIFDEGMHISEQAKYVRTLNVCRRNL